jgi:hypothetical protein
MDPCEVCKRCANPLEWLIERVPRHAEPLLFAQREHLAPIDLGVESALAVGQVLKVNLAQQRPKLGLWDDVLALCNQGRQNAFGNPLGRQGLDAVVT